MTEFNVPVSYYWQNDQDYTLKYFQSHFVIKTQTESVTLSFIMYRVVHFPHLGEAEFAVYRPTQDDVT